MKKLILSLMLGMSVISCSQNASDAFVGTWQNLGMENLKVRISKHEGGSGYTVVEEVYHKATPADKRFGVPPHPASTDIRTYSGVQDGNSINVAIGLGIVSPMEIKNDQLVFDTGRSCDNCRFFKKSINSSF